MSAPPLRKNRIAADTMHEFIPTLPLSGKPLPGKPLPNKPLPGKLAHPRYLPHVDGFRVIALAGVLLFHFEVQAVKAGFLGVDCFLVLSGFLITRNIVNSIQNSTFSFHDFYVRRFWRLYPTSVAVSFLTVICAAITFPPDLAKSVSQSALASSALVSNIHFLQQADYFDHDSTLKPLLHTWSLSLEEQFYALWPLLLFLSCASLKTHRRRHITAILSVCGLSIAFNYGLSAEFPSFVFFMLPTRVYEFGIGALCALTEDLWSITHRPSSFRRGMETLLSCIAFFFVCASYVVHSEPVAPHESLVLLLSTAAMLVTPNSLLSTWVLASRPFRFLGSLTYSAYLTHWPIFVFAKYLSGALNRQIPGPVILIVASFVSATILQQTIENPMRKRKRRPSSSFCTVMTAFVFFCSLLWVKNDYETELGRRGIGDAKFDQRCIETSGRTPVISISYGCEVGDHTGPHSNVTIVGDSYARHFIPAFDVLGKRKGLRFSFVYRASCMMMTPDSPKLKKAKKPCQKFTETRWKLLRGIHVDNSPPIARNSTIIVAGFNRFKSFEERKASLVGVHEELTRLGHRMVISGEVPGMSRDEHWRFECLEAAQTLWMRVVSRLSRKKTSECLGRWLKPKSRYQDDIDGYRRLLRESLPQTAFIDFFTPLCRKDPSQNAVQCRTLWDFDEKGMLGSEPGYSRDGHHLAISGSEFVGGILEKQWPFQVSMKRQNGS